MSRNAKTLNVFIFIIALMLVFFMGQNVSTIELSVGEDSLLINGVDEFTCEIRYDEIIGMELKEAPSYGEMLQGTDKTCKCGTWQNEEWGEYTLAVVDKVDVCIVVETSEGITVFNYESDDSTREFHRAFVEFLQGKGYSVAA